MVTFAGNHLRSSIAWTTTCCFQRISLVIHVGETEVNDLNIVLVIEEQVLRLQVSVANANFMDVFNARYNLLEKPACLIFLESFPFHNIIE